LRYIYVKYKFSVLVTLVASISVMLGFISSPTKLVAQEYFYSSDRLCHSYSGLPNDSDELVFIRGGSFVMGSNNAYQEEAPAHHEIVNDFWISKHQVTNAQFDLFVEKTGYVTRAEKGVPTFDGRFLKGSAIFFQPTLSRSGSWQFTEGVNWKHPEGANSNIVGKDNFPVVHIAYEDALAYAIWRGHDLPTESQWEYAARGGLSQKSYVWGDDLNPEGRHLANTWQGQFPKINLELDGFKVVSPVGCFAPNNFGLFDMAGNVWQITKSLYKPYHSTDKDIFKKITNLYDKDNDHISSVVIKGGSYLCSPNYCMRYRPSARQPQDVMLGTSHIGFRTIINIKKNI
jgi:formylglycine-generating enzyme required for sulfatase activity